MRSREASLPHPGAVLDAAERLGRLHEVGRRVRALAPLPMARAAPTVQLFVNLHAADLTDARLGWIRPRSSRPSPRARCSRSPSARRSKGSRRSRIGSRSCATWASRIAIDDLGAEVRGADELRLARARDRQARHDARARHREERDEAQARRVVGRRLPRPRRAGRRGGHRDDRRAERCWSSWSAICCRSYLLGRPGEPFPGHSWE